jgi:ceramide glucosyltransferase
MMDHPVSVSQWLLLALCWIATSYSLIAVFAMPFFSKGQSSRRVGWTSVSVLKPLCGTEPRLYENLVTFCEQAHPCFQLLFGVCSPVDPAIGVVRRLQAAYPQCDIKLVIDSRVHGRNPKVSNLINMVQWARHEVIVLADSDIAVKPDYLDTVTAPLANIDTGVVTCLYRAQSVGAGGRPVHQRMVRTVGARRACGRLAPLWFWCDSGIAAHDA